MTERNINIIPKKLRPVVYSLVALGSLAAAACGGAGAKTENGDISSPTATAKVEPTVKIEPTAIPTETPRVIKTILDQPVVNVSMSSIREVAESFYATHPGAINLTTTFSPSRPYSKGDLELDLKSCEKGDSPGADARTIAAEREGGCINAIKMIYDGYKTQGLEGLWQIALGVRNYFVTQYPERRERFESNLPKLGVK